MFFESGSTQLPTGQGQWLLCPDSTTSRVCLGRSSGHKFRPVLGALFKQVTFLFSIYDLDGDGSLNLSEVVIAVQDQAVGLWSSQCLTQTSQNFVLGSVIQTFLRSEASSEAFFCSVLHESWGLRFFQVPRFSTFFVARPCTLLPQSESSRKKPLGTAGAGDVSTLRQKQPGHPTSR